MIQGDINDADHPLRRMAIETLEKIEEKLMALPSKEFNQIHKIGIRGAMWYEFEDTLTNLFNKSMVNKSHKPAEDY